MTAPALWRSAEAVEATWGTATRTWAATGVSIDTRTLAPGDLFVALSAARDGHDFVADALAGGAAAAMVSRIPEGVAPDAPLLVVDDVQRGLEALGGAGRSRSGARVLAITGSVGKTTTKDMARAAFGASCRTHAAQASYNNHWGVPLTLARMPRDTQVAIIEIGMNHPGEIAPLSRLAAPHAAIVTTVAPAHLAAFDSVEGIAREKASIFEGLVAGGTAILNADLAVTPILRAAAPGPVIGFGEGAGADLRAARIAVDGEATAVEIAGGPVREVRIGGAGRHLAMNALAVLAAAGALDLDVARAAAALADWHPASGRGGRETVRLPCGAVDLIDDAFNANPASVAAALERLAGAAPGPGGRRIAVLGDMLELGETAPALHAGLAVLPAMGRIDTVHTAGALAAHLRDALPPARRGMHRGTAEALAAEIAGTLQDGDIVLVKGSKSARTARVVDAIRELGQPERR